MLVLYGLSDGTTSSLECVFAYGFEVIHIFRMIIYLNYSQHGNRAMHTL